MKVAISANEVGTRLKDVVKAHLTQAGYEVVDVSDKDIFTATMNVVELVNKGEITRGIVVDDYGVVPFNIAAKNQGISRILMDYLMLQYQQEEARNRK